MSEQKGAAGKLKKGWGRFHYLFTEKGAKIAKEYVALALRPLRSLRRNIAYKLYFNSHGDTPPPTTGYYFPNPHS